MSNWLKKRVVMWCALVVLLGGAQWFSSVRAYTTLSSPPPKTPEDAAASFMAMLTDFSAFPDSDYDGYTRLESKNIMAHLLDQTISHAQMQKVGRYNNSSLSNVAVLLSWMAQMQRSRNYKGNVIEQDADKAVVELQKLIRQCLRPLFVSLKMAAGVSISLLPTPNGRHCPMWIVTF